MASGLLVCSALAALALPIRADAEFLGRAAASGQFESNSNVFDLQSHGAASGAGFPRPQSDNYWAYGAELAGDYVLGRQNLYARVVTKQFNYQRFTHLNHNEYEIVGRFIWKLGDSLDGILGIIRTHSMVPFLDLAGTQLELSVSTRQTESANFDFKLNPQWMLQGGVYSTKSNQPLPEAPDLQLVETGGSATLRYLGFGRLTSGLMASYGSGRYDGSSSDLNPTFRQFQTAAVASFKSRRTMYEAQVGYTRRSSSSGTDNTSGLTGLVDFTYQLTPKTAYRFKIDRQVNSFVANTGSEIDTDAGAGVTWQASHKLSVDFGYAYGYREYPGQGDQVGSKRIDHQQYANLGITYTPQRWVLIRPYANIQTRSSTLNGRDSNSTMYGVSITVMTSDQANANSVPLETHWR